MTLPASAAAREYNSRLGFLCVNPTYQKSIQCENVTLEKKLTSLTVEQAIKSVEICQSLSDLYQDIVLFRFDDLNGEIYLLAGLDIEIVIYSDGNWEFLTNET